MKSSELVWLWAIGNAVLLLAAPSAGFLGATSYLVFAVTLPRALSISFSAIVSLVSVLYVTVLPVTDALPWLPLEPFISACAAVFAGVWRIALEKRVVRCGNSPANVWSGRFRQHVNVAANLLLVCHVVRVVMRGSSLWTAAPWVVAYSALCWPSIRRNVLPRMTAGNALPAAALLAGSTVVSLFALEFASRVLLPEERKRGQMYEFDPGYLFRLVPNSRVVARVPVSEGEWVKVEHVISEQGFRNEYVPPKRPGEFRVLMLGDSFTHGTAVNVQHAIPQLTQELLRATVRGRPVTVVNAGIGGSGPIQQLGMLVNRGLALSPDLVVLQLLPANDVMDSLVFDEVYLRSYNQKWITRIELLRRRHRWPFNVEYRLRTHSRVYRELARITGRDALFNFLLRQIRWIGDFDNRITYPPNEARPYFLESQLTETYPALELGFQRLEEYMLQIRDVSSENGVAFAAYIMPIHATIDDSVWLTYIDQYGDLWTRFGDVERINRIFERENISTFDVSEALSTYDKVEECCYVIDGHLNAVGNHVVAETIRDFVLERYLTE